MGVFNFNEVEFVAFFLVLVRFSTLVVVLPFLGERAVPAPAKVLLALTFTLCMYPILVSTGKIALDSVAVIMSSASLMIFAVALEAMFSLTIGFIAKIFFDVVSIAGEAAGTIMGFASANQYDPFQESQTQVISQFQGALAMLLFITLDGHHLMILSALKSYDIVGLAQFNFTGEFVNYLIKTSSEVIKLGIQFAAPMALSLFAINVVYAVLAKAIPQLNVLVLSFAVSTFIGFFVLLLTTPEFLHVLAAWFEKIGDRMTNAMVLLSK